MVASAWYEPVVLRLVGILEGISFLVLLGVAMPLKYLQGMPDAVRVVGMIHGILFLLFVFGVIRVAQDRDWPRRTLVEGLAASLIPFGTFWFDRRLR